MTSSIKFLKVINTNTFKIVYLKIISVLFNEIRILYNENITSSSNYQKNVYDIEIYYNNIVCEL